MTLDELRAILANPEAWEGLSQAATSLGNRGQRTKVWREIGAAIDAYCDERARTIAAVIQTHAEADAAAQRERDAALVEMGNRVVARAREENGRAVRALLAAADDALGICIDERLGTLAAAIARVRALYPEVAS